MRILELSALEKWNPVIRIFYKLHPAREISYIIISNEPVNQHLKRQAKKIKAKLVYVTKRIKNHSTTKFAELIKTYEL